MLVYLGDFDVAGAALSTARAIGPLLGREGLALVLACRPKGGRHREVAQEVRDALATSGARPGQVLILGRISFAPALAAAADLAIFPARRLPDKMDLPLGLLQSLAAGVPALVANEGPLADLVNAGAAFGVDARDPEALRTAALHLLEDGKQRRALGAAARRHMEREGSVTELGRAHAALYGRLWRQ
jgi:glycosyltransferase involved in cell wall biosynthesis